MGSDLGDQTDQGPPVDGGGEIAQAGDGGAADRSPEVGNGVAGVPCSNDGDCASGFCSDRVCCDSRCDQRCHACNLPGQEGRCTGATAGEDPRQECAQHPEASCGQDGTCDGAGACALYASGRQCGPASCNGSTETPASTCDGQGQCLPGTSRTCPGGLSCQGSSCATSCSSDSVCGPGFFCDVGTCRVRKTPGATCGGASECQSGFCVDGLCCSTACTELCRACNLASAPGTCTPVPAGSDPRNVCQPQAAACQRDGQCDGQGACRLQLPGTSCGSPSCSGTVLTPAATCDGVGVCRAATPRTCGAYACSGAACAVSCSNDGHCNVGYGCMSGSCQALPGPVLHWRFDEGSGAQALDSSPSGFTGSYTGLSGMPSSSVMVPSVIVPNPASRSFLRGNRHTVRLAPMPPALKPSTRFTISAWYRTTTLDDGSGGFMGSEVVSGGDSYILRVRSADIEFTRITQINGSNNFGRCFMPVANRLDGNWHHLAGVLDGTSMRGYFDGVEACQITVPEVAINYARGPDFWVGRHGSGGDVYDFEGNIDDVRVYTRALSAAEVAAIASGRY